MLRLYLSYMGRIGSRDLYEAEQLLITVAAWSDDDIEALPKFYREKAIVYRQLVNAGDC